MEPVGVGVVGCGNISGVYLRNLMRFADTRVVACADQVPDRAGAAAAQYGIAATPDTAALLADPAVEVVVNLTVPRAHAAVTAAALAAGKSVYSEKPLAVTRAEGRRLLEEAGRRGLRLGAAPDTFLGAGYQTARALLDAGAIGVPVAATAFMLCHGHEHWHPAPEFYYQEGGGPLLDMGPYYLTALVSLLGPVRRVCAAARVTFPERTITSDPARVRRVRVETPTHVAGVLEFAGGCVATLVTSFDVWHSHAPLLELYGSEGSLGLPDPNSFGGPLRIRGARDAEWRDVPLRGPYVADSRGLGAADLACALRSGRPHRASGELAFHVLDVMQALLESAEAGRHVPLASTCERPEPLPTDRPWGVLND